MYLILPKTDVQLIRGLTQNLTSMQEMITNKYMFLAFWKYSNSFGVSYVFKYDTTVCL